MKKCDLCRVEHEDSAHFVKLKEAFQINGVTDLCESCFEDFNAITCVVVCDNFQLETHKKNCREMLEILVRITDRTKGV